MTGESIAVTTYQNGAIDASAYTSAGRFSTIRQKRQGSDRWIDGQARTISLTIVGKTTLAAWQVNAPVSGLLGAAITDLPPLQSVDLGSHVNSLGVIETTGLLQLQDHAIVRELDGGKVMKESKGYGVGYDSLTDLVMTQSPGMPSANAIGKNAIRPMVCYGDKLTAIKTLSKLPPQVIDLMDGVSGLGGPFNAFDFGEGPRDRFSMAAGNADTMIVAVEHGGRAYGIVLWIFFKSASGWERGQDLSFGNSAPNSPRDFLIDVARGFSCKNTKDDGTLVSDEEAIDKLREEANQGDADAQFALGHLYAIGRGVKKNEAGAAQWFKAAAATMLRYQYELGFNYAYGRDLTQNDAEALNYFRQVADSKPGDLAYQAYYQLGQIYEHGRGVPVDHVAAFALLSLYPIYPDREMHEYVEQMKISMTADEINAAIALHRQLFSASQDGNITVALDRYLGDPVSK